ncbi:MAG: hypothetical protein ACK4L4_06865 [Gemmobacter sp.]
MTIDFGRIISAKDKAQAELAAAQEAARGRVLAAIEAATLQIVGRVPLAEMLSWTAKETAARSWGTAAGAAGAADLIEVEARVTGEQPDALAQRILHNAEVFRAAVACLAGIRRNSDALIAAAEAPDAVARIATEAESRVAALAQTRD